MSLDCAAHGTGSTGTIRVKPSGTGNAVVAVMVDGVIKWSWHIWATNYNPHANLWDPHTAGGETSRNALFMDRNLGAMEATNNYTASRGLHYQWGRKDPFPINDNLVILANGPVSIDTAIEHPNTFYIESEDWLTPQNNNLWDDINTGKKAIYDPCPAGFRVPLSGEGVLSPWTRLPMQKLTADDVNSGYVWGTSYWPRAGSRNISGESLHGMSGNYWSAWFRFTSTDRYNAYGLLFLSEQLDPNYLTVRANGFSVRCIAE
jgi:hypothetical protein